MVDRDLTPEEFATALGEMAPQLSKEGLLVSDEAAAKLLSNIVPNVKAIKTSVNKGIKIQGGSLSALLAPFKTFGSGFSTSIKSFGVSLQKLKEDFKGTFKKLGEKLNLKKQIGDAFQKRIKSLQDAIKKPFTAIKNTFGRIGNFFGFKTKEQREEEEAKNPAKFIIRYLKRNIEPLLKSLSGLGTAKKDDSGFLNILKSGLAKILAFGLTLSGIAAYFGLDGTAGQTLARTLKEALKFSFRAGGEIVRPFIQALKNLILGLIPDRFLRVAAQKAAQAAARAGQESVEAGGRGSKEYGRTRIGQEVAEAARRGVAGGRITITPAMRQQAIEALPKIGGTSAAATAVEEATEGAAKNSRIFKGLLRVIGSRAFAPLIETILSGRDIAAIKSATNISEKAKQELIGRRVITGIAGLLGGAGGAILGGKIGFALGTVVPGVGNLLGGAIGAIGGGFGGDILGRKVSTLVTNQTDGFRQVGELFHDNNAEREAANIAAIADITGKNLETGLPLNKFFTLPDVQENPSGFVGNFGGVGNLRTNLMTEAELRSMSRAQDISGILPTDDTGDAGAIINDNSQSNATNINNFSSPSGVSPSAVDPILNPIFTAGFGQVTLT